VAVKISFGSLALILALFFEDGIIFSSLVVAVNFGINLTVMNDYIYDYIVDDIAEYLAFL